MGRREDDKGVVPIRIILLALATVIVKISAPVLGVDLTWLQAIVITILAQMFAFMFTGTQGVNIAIVKPKEDDED